jgi:NifU-like protein involved in Fe-S cluster formation
VTVDDYRKRLKAYLEIGYSEKAVIFIFCSLNIGRIDKADIYCKYESDCNNTLFMYLTLDNQLIVDAKFEYIGCMGIQVAASGLTEMIKGLTIEQANCITFNYLLSFLESVPTSKYECLEPALNTFRKGIKEFLTNRKCRAEEG